MFSNWKLPSTAMIESTACGSGGGGDDPATGVLSLSITDGPVDGVAEIWVEFDGITLKPANRPQQEFRFDTPRTFNLKSLNNGKTEHGSIAGTVAIDQLPALCNSNPNTGAGNVAYVFEGFDITPDDIDDEPAEPLTTADIRLDQTYRIAFLSPGEYTVAFTCQAADDIAPDADDPSLLVDNPIIFTRGFNVTVQNGVVETLNFPGG
jgi:hypothetical protein